MNKATYALEKARSQNSKALLSARIGRVPGECGHMCKWYQECSRLAPGAAVRCELSDADCDIDTTQEARARAGKRQERLSSEEIDYSAEYYWRVHVIGLK